MLLGSSLYRLLASVVKVEQKRLGRDIHHGDVLNEYVAHDTAAAPAALEPESDISAEEPAVGHMDVADPSRHLAAHHEASVAMEYSC